MSRQGYLIKHQSKGSPQVYFFSLDEGYLRYYESHDCRELVGEVRLSGCKVIAKSHNRRDGVPFSFFVESRRVIMHGQSYSLSDPVLIELSAFDDIDRQDWGSAILSWRRMYWREPTSSPSSPIEGCSIENTDIMVKIALDKILDEYYPSRIHAKKETKVSLNCASPSKLLADIWSRQAFAFLPRKQCA